MTRKCGWAQTAMANANVLVERRLTALFAADVAGFARAMGMMKMAR